MDRIRRYYVMSFLLSRSVISSAILGGGGSTPPELHITGDNGYTDLSSNSYSVAATGATITGTIYNGHKALSCDCVNDY